MYAERGRPGDWVSGCGEGSFAPGVVVSEHCLIHSVKMKALTIQVQKFLIVVTGDEAVTEMFLIL